MPSLQTQKEISESYGEQIRLNVIETYTNFGRGFTIKIRDLKDSFQEIIRKGGLVITAKRHNDKLMIRALCMTDPVLSEMIKHILEGLLVFKCYVNGSTLEVMQFVDGQVIFDIVGDEYIIRFE